MPCWYFISTLSPESVEHVLSIKRSSVFRVYIVCQVRCSSAINDKICVWKITCEAQLTEEWEAVKVQLKRNRWHIGTGSLFKKRCITKVNYHLHHFRQLHWYHHIPNYKSIEQCSHKPSVENKILLNWSLTRWVHNIDFHIIKMWSMRCVGDAYEQILYHCKSKLTKASYWTNR